MSAYILTFVGGVIIGALLVIVSAGTMTKDEP